MTMYIKRSQSGFTLIELMITLAIIGILAAIAIPSYNNYTRRAYYSELVKATAPYKMGIADCFNSTNDINNCDAGSNGVPPARTSAVGGVASVAVSNGVVTATPVAQNGIVSGDTYVLTPTASTDGILTWASSGQGVTKGYAK